MAENNTTDEQTISYDLRQRRAKLIADCIEDVVIAAKAENYYIWLKNTDDLYSVSKHTFDKLDDKDKAIQDYQALRKKVTEEANKNQSVWLGNTKNAQACADIENALRSLFEHVMDKLEEAGVFGTKSDDEGL